MAYQCPCCNELHEGLPDVGFAKPDPWFNVPSEQRAQRTRLTPDTCIIDNEEFFVRGVVRLPIVGTEDVFGIGAWVSQSRVSFERYLAEATAPGIPPAFGSLSTHLAFYEHPTFGLETSVHFSGGGTRPLIVIEPTAHALSVDQRDGIKLARAWEMVHAIGG
jgi:hypothetical protein